MGNRANVVFKQDRGYLGLYLHNAGYFKKDVAVAVERVINAGRTSDIGYATRIAISDIIGEHWSQDYSYGLYIGTTINEAIADNENDVVVVDFERGLITEYGFDFGEWAISDVKVEFTLEEYVKANR